MNFMVFGVAGSLAVKQIVDMLKRLGLPKKHGLLAAFLTAVVILAANEAAVLSPVFLAWWERIWNVVFCALVAAELYDAQRSLRNH